MEDRTRVVVVDDAPDIRMLVRIFLEQRADLEVVGEAGDGIEAIDVAAATVPDVIVLDVDMPRMDGVTAIPEVRRVAPGVAIVMYSAFDDRREDALERGAAAWFAKTGALSGLADTVAGMRSPGGAPAA